MRQRHIAASVLWRLMPLVCLVRFVGHGLVWLGLIGLRKAFQLRYRTGFATVVLMERAALHSALTAASFAVFRARRGFAALSPRRGSGHGGRSPAAAPSHAR